MTSTRAPYFELCKNAAADVGMMGAKANVAKLRRGAELAVAIYEKSETAWKHGELFQAIAENVTRCIATYYCNWRRSQVRIGTNHEPLLPDKMLSALQEISKYVEKYQPSVQRSRLPALKSSATDIRRLNERITSLHLSQPEYLRQVLEPRDFQESMNDAIVNGIQDMQIDDPELQKSLPIDVSTGVQNLPLFDEQTPHTLGPQWSRPRSYAESVSDVDEPADYAAARRLRSVSGDAEDTSGDEATGDRGYDKPEKRSSEGKKRSSTKKSSKKRRKDSDYAVEEGGSEDDVRQQRSTKRSRRRSSDIDEDSDQSSKTSEPGRASQHPRVSSKLKPQSFLARMVADAGRKGGPVNISHVGNIIGNNITYNK